MNRRALIRRRAEVEINQAVIWYEGKQIGLGREFLAEIGATVRTIAERPESFPVDYKYARRALARRFPYKVYFVVEPDRIEVIAVLHSSQSRSRLRGRL